jgi:hypothetical protein
MNTEWFRSRSADDWWIYLLLAGGALVMGVVVYFIYMTYTPPLTEGDLVGRKFVAAHREQDAPICISRDSKGNCTFWMPQSHWEDDAWYVTVYGCLTSRDGKLRCKETDINVGQDIYDSCEGALYYRRDTHCLPQ